MLPGPTQHITEDSVSDVVPAAEESSVAIREHRNLFQLLTGSISSQESTYDKPDEDILLRTPSQPIPVASITSKLNSGQLFPVLQAKAFEPPPAEPSGQPGFDEEGRFLGLPKTPIARKRAKHFRGFGNRAEEL